MNSKKNSRKYQCFIEISREYFVKFRLSMKFSISGNEPIQNRILMVEFYTLVKI